MKPHGKKSGIFRRFEPRRAAGATGSIRRTHACERGISLLRPDTSSTGKACLGHLIVNSKTRSRPIRFCQSGGKRRQQGLSLAPVLKAALPVDMAKRTDRDKTAAPQIRSRMGMVERAERIIGACDDQSGEAYLLRRRIGESGPPEGMTRTADPGPPQEMLRQRQAKKPAANERPADRQGCGRPAGEGLPMRRRRAPGLKSSPPDRVFPNRLVENVAFPGSTFPSVFANEPRPNRQSPAI